MMKIVVIPKDGVQAKPAGASGSGKSRSVPSPSAPVRNAAPVVVTESESSPAHHEIANHEPMDPHADLRMTLVKFLY